MDQFYLTGCHMSYENTELALLALCLSKGPMAMIPYVTFFLRKLLPNILNFLKRLIFYVKTGGRSMASECLRRRGRGNSAPRPLPR